MRSSRSLMVAGVAAIVGLAGCVDQSGNAVAFCSRTAEILAGSDDETLSKDQAVFISDEIEKTMRYAEDSSRAVRRAARRLADAYADVRAIAGDDDVDPGDVEERYANLALRREDMRVECAVISPDTSPPDSAVEAS